MLVTHIVDILGRWGVRGISKYLYSLRTLGELMHTQEFRRILTHKLTQKGYFSDFYTLCWMGVTLDLPLYRGVH